MFSKNTLAQTDEFAVHYDEYISKTNWYGPQFMFGLLYEFIQKEENLLDLGIGTGLSSVLFEKAGLKIYGVDGSEEMIRICRDKAITEDIRQADLVDFKSPYGVAIFDHVISQGVFHLIGHLESVFHEVARSLRKGGTFTFTYDQYKKDKNEGFRRETDEGVYTKTNEDSGILVFQHTRDYFADLLELYKMKIERETEFLAYRDSSSGREYYFSVIVAQKL